MDICIHTNVFLHLYIRLIFQNVLAVKISHKPYTIHTKPTTTTTVLVNRA